VSAEPAIKTDYGVRRPDVVAYKPGEAAVMSTSLSSVTYWVHSRMAILGSAGSTKPQVRVWAAEKAGVSTASVRVSALIFSWRGALCSQSAGDMKELGIPMPTLEVMSLRVFERGHTAWNCHAIRP